MHTRDHLIAALARTVVPSSDYDLTSAAPPQGRALRPAAVLIAVDEGRVWLTKRASGLKHHPGQIAFPGGKVDAGETPIQAALREADEEIALPPSCVEILGTLPPHETVTGFSMVPVLGLVSPFAPTPYPDEVEEVFAVPLTHLADLSRYRVEHRMWNGTARHFYTVPWGPYYIWGATARILRGLAERLQ